MWLTLPLAGALVLSASANTQNVAGAQIAQAVERALTDRLQERPTATVSITGRVSDQIVPAGVLAIEPGAVSGPWPRARAGVPVRLRVNGRTVRTLTVWAEARDMRPVLVYSDRYAAQKAGADLRMREAIVDMACCSGTPVAAPSDIATLRVKRVVRAGEPVMLGDFEPRPDIARQQHVDIEVATGPVRIVASGIALGDGRIGDRISVRADQSQAVLHGRVAAKNKVVVDE